MRNFLATALVFTTVAIAASAAAQTVAPAASATIRRLPELGIFDQAPVGSDVQSGYFRTTEQNREFRRGFAEFSIPSGGLLSATLVLAENRAWTAFPVPPDLHRLSAYSPADLAVTTDDYDRPGSEVGTFFTDANEATQTFTFDVTALATAHAGATLGFRIQLDVDPAEEGFVPLGSGFEVTLAIVTSSPLAVGFEFTPQTLNLSSHGRWVTGTIEPPPPFAAADIDLSSIRLNETVPVDPDAPVVLQDHDGNGIVDLAVKFARDDVKRTVSPGDHVPVVATGMLAGEPFAGTDYIVVKRGRVTSPVAGARLAAGSETLVRWETSGGLQPLESVGLRFSPDGGLSWSQVAAGQINSGRYAWTVPAVATERGRLAVLSESQDADVLAESEEFAITSFSGVPEGVQPALAIRARMPSTTPDGRLRVEFTLRDASPARLELMDVTGRTLATRPVGALGAGPHTIELSSVGSLAPGIYFLRLTQGREVRARVAVLH